MSVKPKVIMPGAEEDARINAGIAADPDTFELSDAAFKRLKRLLKYLSTPRQQKIPAAWNAL